MFADVAGVLEAVQPKVGRWNLNLTFTHLSPFSIAAETCSFRREAVSVGEPTHNT